MKLNKILALFAAVALMFAPSCSDDTPATPLEQTQGENAGISHNSLTFEWDKVAGATQYGYELFDNNDNIVIRSVTDKNNVIISNLKPATEYTLKVWAYAAIGSGYTTSEPIVLKATTNALKSIGKPTLEYSRQGVSNVITWKKVSNADAYAYVLTNSSGVVVESGSTTSRKVTFSNLELGTYNLSVKATSTADGYEPEGEAASIEFTVEDVFVWKVEGVYKSVVLGKSWNATLVYYGDDNYSLQGWYGVEGYNLDFYLDYSDEEDIFSIASGLYTYDSATGNYTVPTGRTDLSSVYLYPWWNYSTFTGSEMSGAIGLFVWSSNANDYVTDTFTWSSSSQGSPADNFVGTWKSSMSGYSAINDNWTFVEFSYPNETVEITKVDDNTISMPALYFTDEKMNVKINMADRTLTVAPMTVWEWYILASNESDETPVVGKINDDGSFEFNNWNAWYEGDVYMESCKAKYTK